MKTTKQYLLEIQFKHQQKEGRWHYGAAYDKGVGERFYPSLKEAQAARDRLLRKFNRAYRYGADGKRHETHEIGGGFAADMVTTKEIDDMNRIVAWRIRVREVTPWELAETWSEE